MKVSKKQFIFGGVCLILGFMIALQLRIYSKQRSKINPASFDDLNKQLESLIQQRDDLSKKVNELMGKIDSYEKAAASSSEYATNMKVELDSLRKLAGLTDVEGPGVVITLTPPVDVTSMSPFEINSIALLDVVNELNAAGAEAISINEERYVSRTQIREAGAAIKINGTPFSPSKEFVIKAIGNSKTLEAAFNLPGGTRDKLTEEFGIKMTISEQENVKIYKYNKYIDFKYIKVR